VMKLHVRTRGWLLCLVASSLTTAADAWEIRLRDAVSLHAAVVRLGDAAEVVGAEGELSGVERLILAPGPTPSHRRVLRSDDIRRILEYRGVDMKQCRIIGNAAVVMYDREAVAPSDAAFAPGFASRATATPRSASPHSVPADVARRIEEHVIRRLASHWGMQGKWSVETTFGSREIARIPASFDEVTVEGWPASDAKRDQPLAAEVVGKRTLTARFATAGGTIDVPCDVVITPLVATVVTTRAVERGEVLQSPDLETRWVRQTDPASRHAATLERILGRQARQALRPGQTVEASLLVEPMMVRRRDTIEVIAARGAVSVRRPAVALADGVLGDTITVETTDGTKSRFLARVVGTRLAEVSVSTPVASRDAQQ
jgi:flagella basal body P-ring formation protein FlgA